mmetsp:Transcript_70257/g.111729  ORF Transcript_70257/g.111729 Transcript_70257/m.111729 type:complete len:180 (-) Transcript_70257:232-771(-)
MSSCELYELYFMQHSSSSCWRYEPFDYDNRTTPTYLQTTHARRCDTIYSKTPPLQCKQHSDSDTNSSHSRSNSLPSNERKKHTQSQDFEMNANQKSSVQDDDDDDVVMMRQQSKTVATNANTEQRKNHSILGRRTFATAFGQHAHNGCHANREQNANANHLQHAYQVQMPWCKKQKTID